MQQKRYSAQKAGTTYVYDFPEMFRQALVKMWRDYYAEREMDDHEVELDCPMIFLSVNRFKKVQSL